MSYWVYRTLAMLPLTLKYAMVPVLAWLLRDVLRYRRNVVAQNLARAFPELSLEALETINRRFYRQLVETALEIVHGYGMTQREYAARVTLVNPELLIRLSDQQQRSVVVLLIHQGNWEWMLHGAAAQQALPIDPVYKPLRNSGADRFALELRSQFGAEPITAATAARDILRKRRQARLCAILADQSPGDRERRHWTTTLHQDTAWYTGAATIARLTRSPVCFAQCRRTARGHYDIQFHEITGDPRSLDEAAIIERYAELAEHAIREQPDSYLWSNRRWKLERPQAEASSTVDDVKD